MCPYCGNSVECTFRFCPSCAAPLRTKLVEFFMPHPGVAADRNRALRVSQYLLTDQSRHVRFSIWHNDHAEAALSLSDSEAARLAAFIIRPLAAPQKAPLDRLRSRTRSQ